jgi:hypothetical protein
MLINCSYCSARVDGSQLSSVDKYESAPDGSLEGGMRISLLKCPSCENALVAKQDYDIIFSEGEWWNTKRVWPQPEAGFDSSIPQEVRVSLSEARGCLGGGFYTASVVMCGRALEAIGRHFHVSSENGKPDRLMLGRGLEQLHNSGKIDQRLYQWGKELQEHRNLAAHATGHSFQKNDAEDLFEFLNAICEYLFVLQDRYDRFIRRKEDRKKAKEGKTDKGDAPQ